MSSYMHGLRRRLALVLVIAFAGVLLGALPAFAAGAGSVPSLSGMAHVQDEGDTDGTSIPQGVELGTTGKSERLEAIKLSTSDANVKLDYQVHVQNIGWQDPVSTGELAGTSGQSLRLEAVKIWVDEPHSTQYDVYYRTHVQNIGWMDWAKNGQAAGSQGQSLRMEALQVILVGKNYAAPSPSPKNDADEAYSCPLVTTQAHVQDIGWQDPVIDGDTAGTTGSSKRVEAIRVSLNTDNLGPEHQGMQGSIQYRAHVQNIGWQDWVKDGELAGTEGKSLRVEAFQMKLAGTVADAYDVYYRVHAQNIGWMGWTKNGEPSGTAGSSLRLEAIEIKLVAKDDPDKPEPTQDSFKDAGAIMGASLTTVDKMVSYYNSKAASVGFSYQQYYVDHPELKAPNIKAFCQFLYDEANAEGVRAEVLFAQVMHETGWLRFGNLVEPYQCNFGGLGATGPGVHGEVFPDVQIGLRAQVQHLKAYASTEPLNNACVDNRFKYVKRGCAPTISGLAGTWAASMNYADALKTYMDALLAL